MGDGERECDKKRGETKEESARQLVASGVPLGKLVAKSGPVASVLHECVRVRVCANGI